MANAATPITNLNHSLGVEAQKFYRELHSNLNWAQENLNISNLSGYTFSKRNDQYNTIVIKRNGTAIATIGNNGQMTTTRAFTSEDYRNLAIINNTIENGRQNGSTIDMDKILNNLDLTPNTLVKLLIEELMKRFIAYYENLDEYHKTMAQMTKTEQQPNPKEGIGNPQGGIELA